MAVNDTKTKTSAQANATIRSLRQAQTDDKHNFDIEQNNTLDYNLLDVPSQDISHKVIVPGELIEKH